MTIYSSLLHHGFVLMCVVLAMLLSIHRAVVGKSQALDVIHLAPLMPSMPSFSKPFTSVPPLCPQPGLQIVGYAREFCAFQHVKTT
jgi:hypothetical protein